MNTQTNKQKVAEKVVFALLFIVPLVVATLFEVLNPKF